MFRRSASAGAVVAASAMVMGLVASPAAQAAIAVDAPASTGSHAQSPAPAGAAQPSARATDPNATPSTPRSLGTTVRHAADVRHRFGLSTDPAVIEQSEGQEGLDKSYLGIPLRDSEVAEMQRRDQVGQRLEAVSNRLRDHQANKFAGAWLDQARGGRVIVASTNASSVSRAELLALLPLGSELEVRQVEVSETNLDAIYDRVSAETGALAAKGIEVAGIGTEVMENHVRIDLAYGASHADVRFVQQRYGTRGVLVDVLPASTGPAASRFATTGPLYGGARIVVNGYACTAALTAKGRSGVYQYGITAGHCYNGGSYRQGSSSGSSLGQGIKEDNGFFRGTTTTCDCTDFGSINGKQTNSVIVNGGSLYTFGNYASVSGNYYAGRPMCISGATTNAVLCDQIRVINQTDTYSELGHKTTVTNMIRMYCPIRGGDSGAPTGNGPTWLGVADYGNSWTDGSNKCGDHLVFLDASKVMYVRSVTGDTPNLPAQ